MRRGIVLFLIFLAVAVLLGAGGYWLARHHYVKTDEGTIVLEKRFLTLDDTFVDIRDWGGAEFDRHPNLRKALVDQGYEDVVAEARAEDLKRSIERIGNEFERQVRNVGGAIEDQLEKLEGTIEEEGAKDAPAPDREIPDRELEER